MIARETNWAGNIVYRAARVARPRSVSEARELVGENGQVRAVGTGHSFNRIADTPGMLISLADLPPVIDVGPGASVTVAGGVHYGELSEQLNAAGYALPTLASLPHLSGVGAVATATHGSGDAQGNLATIVSGLELITADGGLRTVRRDTGGEEFRGCVVGLGSLGLVTALTLDVVPAFTVRQYVYEGLPMAMLQSHFDEIFGSVYSVSVFTNWRGDRHGQLWLKVREGERDGWQPALRWMDATLADRQLHPIPGGDPGYATQQLGVPGPWHELLPHFRAEFTPSSGQELQSEYLVPRQVAAGAFDALASLGSLLAPVLQIAEIRTVAPDDLWLSPSFQRDTVALHFTWIEDTAAVTPVIAAMEHLLTPLGARPHWAKVFGMPPHVVRALYPRSAGFQDLLGRYDPGGKFRNGFIDKYFPVPH
ncbi:MAG: FAD-binding protein [Streptosporangiaceae bacterium]